MSVRFCYRWFGEDDNVQLSHIRQIPCISSIVSACYDVPPGEVWPESSVLKLIENAAAHGLSFDVVEGLPVHEAIKLGSPERERYIEAYRQNLRLLGRLGVKVVCNNFMPMFGWFRTDLEHRLEDGSLTTSFDYEAASMKALQTGKYKLPGWHFSTQADSFHQVREAYLALGQDNLRRNLFSFLDAVVPVAQESGIRLALHPDDPPIPLFGLPRVVSTADDLRLIFEHQPLSANAMTLCTGSLGSVASNDLVAIAAEFAPRIAFVHARQVKRWGKNSFVETAHPTMCGDLPMGDILAALRDGGFSGYLRSDHGRMIWGEEGRPGYGLYDRALGISYLHGLWEGLNNQYQPLRAEKGGTP